MNKMIKIFTMALAVICVSCSDWLDVQPSDRIAEDNNFSNLAGFKKALNGIYIELNQRDLYGSTLSCKFIEILAQRYAVGEENKANKEIMAFQYGGATAKGKLTSIWRTAYSLIANVNLLLKNCETHRDALSDEYYHLIKGEALALRAFLQFDLFRLFGPVYGIPSSGNEVPYYTEFSFDVAPKVSSEEYVKLVIQDLLSAEGELKDDPIIEYGVEGNDKDTFLQYRNLRLNYYAVQALLARVYWYIGDTENANAYANKVIAIQEEKFPWITPAKLTNTGSPDRVFSSEVLFSLQNLERNNLFTDYFDGQNLKIQTLLAPREDVLDYVFENDKTDYRYVGTLNNSIELSGVVYHIFNKYQGTDSLYNQMIPLLRVSEAYMIAAETGSDEEEQLNNLNTLLNHRGLRSVDYYDYYYLENEWKKEFYGEGQLFFWYKRNNAGEMQSATDPYGTVSVRPENYVMPIPDGETQYN